jgi:hypothetical protein
MKSFTTVRSRSSAVIGLDGRGAVVRRLHGVLARLEGALVGRADLRRHALDVALARLLALHVGVLAAPVKTVNSRPSRREDASEPCPNWRAILEQAGLTLATINVSDRWSVLDPRPADTSGS